MPTTRDGSNMPGSGAFVTAWTPLLLAPALHSQAPVAYQAGRADGIGTETLAHLVDGPGGLVP